MPPPPLAEVWDDDDDWRGLASPQERRRRQNRLHQREHRKKRHLKRLGLSSEASSASVEDSAPKSVVTVRKYTYTCPVVTPNNHQSLLHLLRRCDFQHKILQFLQKASVDWSLGRMILTDLPVLTRLNSFDALTRNASILQIPVELLESEDGLSPLNFYGPQLRGAASQFPSHLSPTALQRTVRHHPWLDLFPMPKMRDNILRGFQAGQLDEDRISEELVCDLLNLDATSDTSLMIWGDSWDVKGWEFSPEFFVKWAPLLKGCTDVLQATNYWRGKRNETQLIFDLD